MVSEPTLHLAAVSTQPRDRSRRGWQALCVFIQFVVLVSGVRRYPHENFSQ